MNADIETEFRTAVDTARTALANFNAEPLVNSKRGGPRLSPWFRVWKEASEVAQRWHRQLADAAHRERHPFQDEIDEMERLLKGDE